MVLAGTWSGVGGCMCEWLLKSVRESVADSCSHGGIVHCIKGYIFVCDC